MKTKTTRVAAVLLAMLFWISTPWMVLAVTINITQYPYSASTTSSDNGPAINSAISYLQAQGGGAIYIPAGNWKFATPIVIGSTTGQCGSLIIRGDGAHQRGWQGGTDLIFTDTTGTKDAITCDQSVNPCSPRLIIRDLAIDGGTQSQVTTTGNNNSLPNNHYGLRLKQSYYFQLSGVTVTGFKAAGIVIDNSYYGAIRDADVAYCGIGIDCNSPNAVSFRNLSIHNCTTGIHNPETMIGAAIEGNYGNGVVCDNGTYFYGSTLYDNNTGCSFHDCYFSNNNASDTAEGSDIYINQTSTYYQQNSPIYISLSGNCTFTGATAGEGSRSNAYRRVEGIPWSITRTGATRFIPTTTWALLDIPPGYGEVFNDLSTETNPLNLSWTSGNTINTYLLQYVPETLTVIAH